MSIAAAMAKAGPGKRAAMRKFARKKARKKTGRKKKARKKASKKRRSKKGRKKGAKKRKSFRTTVKVGNTKLKGRCRSGKVFKFSGASTRMFGKRLTAIRGRCVAVKKS